jgi:hypothetical protein
MKTKTQITVLFVIVLTSCYGMVEGQIRSDFVLADNGLHPCIEVDREGHLHATWDTFEGVYYKLFDSLGNPLIIFRKIPNSDMLPRLTVITEYAVIVWFNRTVHELSYIVGQVFSINGELVSDPIEFNNKGRTPDVCFLNDSTFIVAWIDNFSQGVFGQISTRSSQFIGERLVLSDHEIPYRYFNYGNPRVLSNIANGNFIVIWRDDHLGSNKIFGRLFYSDGSPQDSSFLISDDPELTDIFYMSVAMGPNGDFVVVWEGSKANLKQVQWRWFQTDGTAIGPSEPIVSEVDTIIWSPCVDIAIDQDGRCVVVWEHEKNGYRKIYAQRFLPDRTLLGSSFRVSTETDTFDQIFPSVAFCQGKIYTAWQQTSKGPDYKMWANIIDFDKPPAHVETEPTHFPKGFRLHQNYPNPFNSITAIQYEVSRRSHINLKIFNILGNEIITLISEEVMPGTYEVHWNAKDLQEGDVPSGIYLYQLTIGANIQTKKMVLVQ